MWPHVGTIVCKVGGDPAIRLREKRFCEITNMAKWKNFEIFEKFEI